MSASNPYFDWLGLAPDVESPNFYQLLGLGPADCADKKIVAEAANRQLAKLKRFKSVENLAAIRRLLEEIKGAAKCLANPDLRNAYNAKLLNATMQRNSKAMDNSPSTPQPTKPSVQAIPAAIPLAIPVAEPQQEKEVEDVSGGMSTAVQAARANAELEFELLAKGKPHKRRSLVPLVLSILMTLVVVAVAAIVFRPELREQIFGSSLGSSESTKSNVVVPELSVPKGGPLASAPEMKIAVPMEPTQFAGNSIAKPPPFMEPPPDTAVASPPAQAPAEPANGVYPVVDPPRQLAIPDSAVDFYSRSIVASLAANDIDAAVDLYSRLDSDAISDQRIDLFLRLGLVANAYTLYRNWLRECSGRIPGGTSLEIGAERMTIGVVEASQDFMIVRDRGVNYRYPLELVPGSVCWATIEQMRSGDPLAPIVKALVGGVRNWEQPHAIEQAIAETAAYNPPDPLCQQTKDAVLAWLQIDRALMLGNPGPQVELGDSGFTEAMSQVAAQYAAAQPLQGEIHEWVQAAFLEADPLQRLALLQHAKNASVEQCKVALAASLNLEIARSLKSEVANAENIKMIQGFGNKNLDEREGTRLLVHILQLVKESDNPLNATQVQTALRIASKIADKLKLDNFTDAIQKAASRK